MNISWKEAILQAQKKIDQVLDIQEQAEEPEELGESSTLPLETSQESVFTFEPTLPPVINNLLIGEDIQTIVSSDIEQLPRDCTSTPSPTEAFIEIHHELENTPPNNEEMLLKTINGLKKELTEYRNANQMLIESNASLERQLESSRFLGNQTVVDMLREEKSESEQDLLLWKNKYTASQQHNDRLLEALGIFTSYWKSMKQQLRHCKNEMEIVKNTLKTGELSNEAEMRRFTELVEKFKIAQNKNDSLKSKNCTKSSTRSNWIEEPMSSSRITVENWTQTSFHQEQRNERKRSENGPETVTSNNVLPLLEIIEKLESEKEKMLGEQRKKENEIRDLQNQLNQTLIMHGEKMEVLDELAIDNEDLRAIMKEQALMLTKM